MVEKPHYSAEETTTARVASQTVATSMAGACQGLEEYDEKKQTISETEMEIDGHVDHERVVELKMQEMINEPDADGNGANDLPEFLPSSVGKVKDTGIEEELVEAIKVIDQDENKATIEKLIVNSGTSFLRTHMEFEGVPWRFIECWLHEQVKAHRTRTVFVTHAKKHWTWRERCDQDGRDNESQNH